MTSEKAWYWLAAGVLALGLNGAYQDGQFGWVHGIADRSTEIVERASMRGARSRNRLSIRFVHKSAGSTKCPSAEM